MLNINELREAIDQETELKDTLTTFLEYLIQRNLRTGDIRVSFTGETVKQIIPKQTILACNWFVEKAVLKKQFVYVCDTREEEIDLDIDQAEYLEAMVADFMLSPFDGSPQGNLKDKLFYYYEVRPLDYEGYIEYKPLQVEKFFNNVVKLEASIRDTEEKIYNLREQYIKLFHELTPVQKKKLSDRIHETHSNSVFVEFLHNCGGSPYV